MDIKYKILGILVFSLSNTVWAADIFQGAEEVEIDPELANNPLISDFLNPDEKVEARKSKEKWERFKSLEEQGVNYVPSSAYGEKAEEVPLPPSSYSANPFENRLEYVEENLGMNKQKNPY